MPIQIYNVSNLVESLLFELSYDDIELFFVTLYRSPPQTMDEFDLFLEKLENDLQNLLNKNPFLITVLGDFNAKLKSGKQMMSIQNKGLELMK